MRQGFPFDQEFVGNVGREFLVYQAMIPLKPEAQQMFAEAEFDAVTP